jgi:UDP-glucose 4-epimerase
MSLDDAVDLVFYAFNNGRNGDIFVQKSPASTIETLAYAISTLIKKSNPLIDIIGTRHGEKLYEVLLSREEMVAAEDLGDYYRIPPDLRDLNYERYIDQGKLEISNSVEYTSHNTERLDKVGMQEMLIKLNFIKEAINGNITDTEK